MYTKEYREYLKDCLNDEDFDLKTIENYHEWVEHEISIENDRCQQCESLNTFEEGSMLICYDCGYELPIKRIKYYE